MINCENPDLFTEEFGILLLLTGILRGWEQMVSLFSVSPFIG